MVQAFSRHTLRRAAMLLLASLAISGPIYAQTEPVDRAGAAALDDARAIVILTQGEQLADFMLDQLAPVMAQAVLGQLSSDPSLAGLMAKIDAQYVGGREGFVADFVQRFRTQFLKRYPEVNEEGAKLFARELGPTSLRQIREFYESPAGRALIAVNTKIQTELSKVGERIGEEVAIAEMTALITEIENRPEPEKAAR